MSNFLWPLKRPVVWLQKSNFLGTFTTDAAGQLDVLRHDGDTLGVDGAQVGVLEETNQVSLTGLLKWEKSRIRTFLVPNL